jgi:hypothetical protein
VGVEDSCRRVLFWAISDKLSTQHQLEAGQQGRPRGNGELGALARLGKGSCSSMEAVKLKRASGEWSLGQNYGNPCLRPHLLGFTQHSAKFKRDAAAVWLLARNERSRH